MSDLIAALGLVLVIEGAAYALFPEALKSLLTTVLTLPTGVLRRAGLVLGAAGFGIVWLVRG